MTAHEVMEIFGNRIGSRNGNVALETDFSSATQAPA